MYDSEKSSLSFRQPLVALTVAPLISAPSRKDGDVEAYGTEMPQSSSIETLSDKSDRSSAWKEKPSLLMRDSSTVPTTPSRPVALHVAQGSSSTELKQDKGSSGVKAEAEGEVEDERKREREHKKRSKNWTRPETLKLIRMRTDLDARFVKSGRKAELWEEIAKALQRDKFSRDGQQCKDKWEKLTAGYKEVRDGFRDKEDNPFYEELHRLLSFKQQRKEGEREGTFTSEKRDVVEGKHLGSSGKDSGSKQAEQIAPACAANADTAMLKRCEEVSPARKRKRGQKFIAVSDLSAAQNLLETLITRQQRFFRETLDAMEKKDQLRERIRQEREEKWRAEERAQRCVINNAMIVLTQKLLGERLGPTAAAPVTAAPVVIQLPEGPQGPKKRSKNWKRSEVLQLIKYRGEMESRFAKSTRRAALWEELGEKLAAQGVKRDGKQCREKWDKLMAEYKDVSDGRREQGESPYFAELTAFVGRPVDAVPLVS